MVKDKLKNTWKQLKSNMSAGDKVIEINKEVKSRANKAPWYKKPTVGDLKLAYKTNAKNIR